MATDGELDFKVKITTTGVSVPFSLGTKHCRRVPVLDTNTSTQDDFGCPWPESDYRHAVHCFIWAPWPQGRVIHNQYATKAAILMQVRFDGSLGFAGGMVDADGPQISADDVVDALNRELLEEINLNADKFRVSRHDHLFTDVDDVHKLILHFFELKLTEDQIREVERDALTAVHHADEVFGLTRVPLYTMDDGFRGFPVFLNNAFVGNSKEQLLGALSMLDIMTAEEISTVQRAERGFFESRHRQT